MVIQSRYIIVLYVLLLPYTSCAQANKYDIISITEATVLGVGLGATKAEVVRSLGNYDSLKTSFDPIVDEDTSMRYYYRESFFDVESGEVAGFTIKNSEYPVTYKQIRIGDSIKDIKDIFPKSYRQLNKEEERLEKILVIQVGDTGEDVIYDIELLLIFSGSTLKQMVLWTPL